MKEKEKEREEILHALHASRTAFTKGVTDLQGSLQISPRIRRSIAAYSLWILGGAGVIGFLLASRKPKIVYVPSPDHAPASAPSTRSSKDSGTIRTRLGFLAGAIAMIKWILPIIRPLLVSYASRKASDYVRRN